MPLEDEALRKELVRMFLEDCPVLMSDIRSAIARQDAAGLRLAAHTLKGSIGVFKDQPAFESALKIELVGRQADWEQVEVAWKTLEEETNRLSALLASDVTLPPLC